MATKLVLSTAGGLLLSGLLAVGTAIAADPGQLDRTFSGDGIRRIDLGGREVAEWAFLDASGRITVVGTRISSDGGDIALARLRASGALEGSFSGDGRRVVNPPPDNDEPAAAETLPDGGTLVFGLIGSRGYYLMRFLSDGRTDASFGGGIVRGSFPGRTTYGDMIVLADGRILVLGNSDGRTLVKAHRADGSRAIGFGNNGTASIGGISSDVLFHPAGRVLIAGVRDGRRLVIDALRLSGARDNGFGNNGRASIAIDAQSGDDVGNPAVAVLANGDVAYATDVFDGNDFTTDLIVARFTASGHARAAFGGGDGWRRVDVAAVEVALTVAPLPSGGLVLGGFAGDDFFDDQPSDLLLVALRPDGRLRKGFGNNGVRRTDLGMSGDVAAFAALARDGRLTVAGRAGSDMLVARFGL